MFLILLSVGLMTLDHRTRELDRVRSWLGTLVYPVYYVVGLPETILDWAGETFATRRRLQEENARLHTENLILHAQLQKFEALEAENVRLRNLLNSPIERSERVLIANLLSVDLDPYRHEVVINRGSRKHVFRGQPVIDAHGVVGQVIEVTPLTATVMLITDPAHALPVQVNRNGLRSIALGTGNMERLSLPHIPKSADIRSGDLLVTSGLGGRFPRGYPVARVEEVVIDPGKAFAQVYARPLAELDRSREVLLIWPEDVPTDIAGEKASTDPAPETAATAVEDDRKRGRRTR